MADRPTLKSRSIDRLVLRSGDIGLQVAAKGAEPQSLVGPGGVEYLWHGRTAWYRHAPFLFPIICRVPDDHITVDGQRYRMKQHGLLRDRSFSVVDHGPSHARFELYSDSVTRESFPFEFTYAVTHTVDDDGVAVRIEVQNRSDVPMPYATGWHPAFRWPLGATQDTRGHRIEFAEPEPGPVRRVDNNLLAPGFEPPVAGDGSLELRRDLFEAGAVIMTDVRSRSVSYSSPSGSGLRLDAEGFTGWTLWTAPGGDFICVEPWAGEPAPAGFDGEFADHPGVSSLAAGQTDVKTVRLTLL